MTADPKRLASAKAALELIKGKKDDEIARILANKVDPLDLLALWQHCWEEEQAGRNTMANKRAMYIAKKAIEELPSQNVDSLEKLQKSLGKLGLIH